MNSQLMSDKHPFHSDGFPSNTSAVVMDALHITRKISPYHTFGASACNLARVIMWSELKRIEV